MIEKGDIVRFRDKWLAKVSWVKEGEVSIQYLPSKPNVMSLTNVVKESEVVLVRKGISSLFGDLFIQKTDEELREMLKGERRARTILPEEKERVSRKKSLTKDLLAEMSEEDQVALLEFLSKKGKKKI